MDVKTRLKIIEGHLQELRVALEAQPAATAFDKLVFHALEAGAQQVSYREVDTVLKARNMEKTARFTQRYASPSKKIGDVEQAYKERATPRLTGHSAQHHGLQKHSVGGFYPWAIVGIGNGAVTHYELHNLVTDERVCHRVIVHDVVLHFHGTHGYANAHSCLEAIIEHGYGARWGAYVAKPAAQGASQR